MAPASALAYGQLAGVATLAGHMQLAPEMTFGFEPNCVLAGKLGSTGGTVITGGGRAYRTQCAHRAAAARMTGPGME